MNYTLCLHKIALMNQSIAQSDPVNTFSKYKNKYQLVTSQLYDKNPAKYNNRNVRIVSSNDGIQSMLRVAEYNRRMMRNRKGLSPRVINSPPVLTPSATASWDNALPLANYKAPPRTGRLLYSNIPRRQRSTNSIKLYKVR